MTKPVLFLSHSSLDNDRASALNQALKAGGLVETTFDVQNLRHGEEWRPQLYRWMARCQGGVLLLTEQVMAQPHWVLQEAIFLRARAMLEGPAFRLFVLIDAAVPAHPNWSTLFAPLALDALQHTRLLDPAQPLTAAAAAVETGMQALTAFADDHQGRLAELIFDRLDPFFAERAAAQDIATGLEIDDAWWQGIVGPEHALRSLVARRLAAGDLRGFANLGVLFNNLQRKADEPRRAALLGVLQSHWVPLANADRLARAVDLLREPGANELPPNIVLLHTEFRGAERVADLHRERRFQPYGRLGLWVPLLPGNESAAGLRERLRSALQQRLFEFEPDITAQEMLPVLDSERHDGNYTFVHVGGAVLAAHLLPVAREFWPCLFVVTVSEPGCTQLASEIGITAVRPADPLAEVRQMRAIGAAWALARAPLNPRSPSP